MMTLLELLASLPDEALREGAQLGFTDGHGREFTITFGQRVEPDRSHYCHEWRPVCVAAHG